MTPRAHLRNLYWRSLLLLVCVALGAIAYTRAARAQDQCASCVATVRVGSPAAGAIPLAGTGAAAVAARWIGAATASSDKAAVAVPTTAAIGRSARAGLR